LIIKYPFDHEYLILMRVCVFIIAGPITKLCAWGEEDSAKMLEIADSELEIRKETSCLQRNACRVLLSQDRPWLRRRSHLGLRT
jgi:hypothetical protein